MALRLRRGTNAERQTITPLSGELIYVTDFATAGVSALWIGDGTTVGGNPVDTDIDTDTVLDLGTKSIADLGDVNIGEDSTTVSDDEVLRYDALSGEWKPRSIELNTLADVSIAGDSTALDHGDVLKYSDDLEAWRPGTLGLENLNNVNGQNWENNDVLQYNAGTQTWRAVSLGIGVGGGATRLEELENVSIGDDSTLPGDNYILKYDLGSGDWRASEFTQTLSTLDDAQVTTPQEKDILVFDSVDGLFKNRTFQLSIDNSPALGGQLDLNGFNITGTGNIQNTGFVQTDILYANTIDGTFVGDFNFDLLSTDVDGTLYGSVYSSDSSLMVDHENRKFYGEFNGNLIGSVDGDLNGSVFADNSTLMVDGVNNEMFAKLFNGGLIGDVIGADGVTVLLNSDTGRFNGDVVGDTTGVHFGRVVGSVEGDVLGSIFADDSSVMIDGLTGTHYGTKFVGDAQGNLLDAAGSIVFNTTTNEITGNLTGNVTGDLNGTVEGSVIGNVQGDLTGSVFTDASTRVIDGLTGEIFVDDITTNGLQINTSGDLLVQRENGTPTLNFTNNQPTVDLSGSALHYLSIIRVNDQAGNRISSIIGVNGNGLTLAKATTAGAVPDTNKIFIGNDGKFGMGTLTPNATLDVQGAIMPGVYADTTARDAAIPTPVAGMMVYLTSTNKHQGYNGTSWNDFY